MSQRPRLSVRAILVSLMVTACGGGRRGVGGDADGGATDSGARDMAVVVADCTGIDRVAGPAEPCCPTFGVDACGPGLFCAAYDGRTVYACYVDHSRLDGESCGADIECLSYRCNTTRGECASSPNTTCSGEVGCGPGPSSTPYACVNERCVASNGSVGAACGAGSDCTSGICVENTCTSGSAGAECTVGEHCLSNICVDGSCSNGDEGDSCGGPADCISNICVNDRCESGNVGGSCSRDGDCSSGFCGNGECRTGARNTVCYQSDQCRSGLTCEGCTESGARGCANPGFCTDGTAGAACASNEVCVGGLLCGQAPPFSELCGFVGPCYGTCGGTCFDDGDCRGGLRCDDLLPPAGAEGMCAPGGTAAAFERCERDFDCADEICADYGPAGFVCSRPREYGASCDTDLSDPGCNVGYQCKPVVAGFGSCVRSRDYVCGAKYDGEWLSTMECATGLSCTRLAARACEGDTTRTCTVDGDCPGSRCVDYFSCRS